MEEVCVAGVKGRSLLDLTDAQAARWSELSRSDTSGPGDFLFLFSEIKQRVSGSRRESDFLSDTFRANVVCIDSKETFFKIAFWKRLHCEAVSGLLGGLFFSLFYLIIF